MTDCIFCRVIAGDVPSADVYEDDSLLAFLDLFPFNKGHVLIVPKEHHQLMRDVAVDDLEAMMRLAQRFTVAMRESELISADACRVSINDGPSAGQEVPHCHLHVEPRYSDGNNHDKSKLSDEDLERYSVAIRDAISD